MKKCDAIHHTENYTVDVMHDIFEGICYYILCESLLLYIQEKKYFNLDVLNNLLKMSSYSKHDKGNEKNSISINELKKHRL